MTAIDKERKYESTEISDIPPDSLILSVLSNSLPFTDFKNWLKTNCSSQKSKLLRLTQTLQVIQRLWTQADKFSIPTLRKLIAHLTNEVADTLKALHKAKTATHNEIAVTFAFLTELKRVLNSLKKVPTFQQINSGGRRIPLDQILWPLKDIASEKRFSPTKINLLSPGILSELIKLWMLYDNPKPKKLSVALYHLGLLAQRNYLASATNKEKQGLLESDHKEDVPSISQNYHVVPAERKSKHGLDSSFWINWHSKYDLEEEIDHLHFFLLGIAKLAERKILSQPIAVKFINDVIEALISQGKNKQLYKNYLAAINALLKYAAVKDPHLLSPHWLKLFKDCIKNSPSIIHLSHDLPHVTTIIKSVYRDQSCPFSVIAQCLNILHQQLNQQPHQDPESVRRATSIILFHSGKLIKKQWLIAEMSLELVDKVNDILKNLLDLVKGEPLDIEMVEDVSDALRGCSFMGIRKHDKSGQQLKSMVLSFLSIHYSSSKDDKRFKLLTSRFAWHLFATREEGEVNYPDVVAKVLEAQKKENKTHPWQQQLTEDKSIERSGRKVLPEIIITPSPADCAVFDIKQGKIIFGTELHGGVHEETDAEDQYKRLITEYITGLRFFACYLDEMTYEKVVKLITEYKPTSVSEKPCQKYDHFFMFVQSLRKAFSNPLEGDMRKETAYTRSQLGRRSDSPDDKQSALLEPSDTKSTLNLAPPADSLVAFKRKKKKKPKKLSKKDQVTAFFEASKKGDVSSVLAILQAGALQNPSTPRPDDRRIIIVIALMYAMQEASLVTDPTKLQLLKEVINHLTNQCPDDLLHKTFPGGPSFCPLVLAILWEKQTEKSNVYKGIFTKLTGKNKKYTWLAVKADAVQQAAKLELPLEAINPLELLQSWSVVAEEKTIIKRPPGTAPIPVKKPVPDEKKLKQTANETYQLAVDCLKQGKNLEGIELLKKAAAQGSIRAEHELGIYYLYVKDIDDNDFKKNYRLIGMSLLGKAVRKEVLSAEKDTKGSTDNEPIVSKLERLIKTSPEKEGWYSYLLGICYISRKKELGEHYLMRASELGEEMADKYKRQLTAFLLEELDEDVIATPSIHEIPDVIGAGKEKDHKGSSSSLLPEGKEPQKIAGAISTTLPGKLNVDIPQPTEAKVNSTAVTSAETLIKETNNILGSDAKLQETKDSLNTQPLTEAKENTLSLPIESKDTHEPTSSPILATDPGSAPPVNPDNKSLLSTPAAIKKPLLDDKVLKQANETCQLGVVCLQQGKTSEGIAHLKSAATQGSTRAEHELGIYYLYSEGIADRLKKDFFQLGMKLLKKAVDKELSSIDKDNKDTTNTDLVSEIKDTGDNELDSLKNKLASINNDFVSLKHDLISILELVLKRNETRAWHTYLRGIQHIYNNNEHVGRQYLQKAIEQEEHMAVKFLAQYNSYLEHEKRISAATTSPSVTKISDVASQGQGEDSSSPLPERKELQIKTGTTSTEVITEPSAAAAPPELSAYTPQPEEKKNQDNNLSVSPLEVTGNPISLLPTDSKDKPHEPTPSAILTRSPGLPSADPGEIPSIDTLIPEPPNENGPFLTNEGQSEMDSQLVGQSSRFFRLPEVATNPLPQDTQGLQKVGLEQLKRPEFPL